MNRSISFYQKAIALVLPVLFSLCVYAYAEELVGTVISADEAQASSLNSSASSQQAQTVDIQEKIESNIQRNFEKLAQNPPHAPEFPHYETNFNAWMFVPIVSVIVIFGGGFFFVVSLVVVRNRAAAERRMQRQEQIQRFIDAGRDVPNQLLNDVDSLVNDENNLAKGVKDTLIGTAIVIFLTFMVGFNIGSVGLIIVAAGLARLVIWKISQSKKSSN